MAWVDGSSIDTGRTEAGSRSSGIINPPISIEGKKSSCESSTVERELVATTPINAPNAPELSTTSRVIQTKAPQLVGLTPSKSGLAGRAIMIGAIRAGKRVD